MTNTSLEKSEQDQMIKQFLTFYVDGRLLGIPVLKVRDVFRADKITPIPLAPKSICGLINLRGHIVTSISLREKLGLCSPAEDVKQMNIAVDYNGEGYSFLVDSIGDVIELQEKDFEKKTQVLDDNIRDFAVGVYKLKDELLIALDVERTVQNCQ